MSEPKFTPGPWIFDGGEMVKCSFGNSVSFVTSTNKTKDMKGCIAYPFKALPEVAGDAEEQRVANGRLIAAAPEMYEFLRYLCASRSNGICDCEDGECDECSINRILKKARGEE